MKTTPRRSAPARLDRGKDRALVLRAPWVALASECATRFLLSAVLAAGQILGEWSPFALGYVAAAGAGAGGFSALLGACLGYLLTQNLADAFRYLATAILIYAVAFAFYDLKLYAARWFMPLCAAFLAGLTGFVYLAEAGWQPEGVVCFATELLLAALSTRLFVLTGAAGREQAGEGAPPAQRRLAGLLTLGALAISLQTVPLPFSLSLGGILSVAAVLWCGRYAGAFAGGAAALALGLCLDLAAGGGTAWAAALGLGGLLGVAGGRWGRHLQVAALLAGMLSVTLWDYAASGSFLPFWDGVLGCCLYLASPLSWLERLAALAPQGGELASSGPAAAAAFSSPPPARPRHGAREAPAAGVSAGVEAVQRRLRRQGTAFRALGEQLSADLDRAAERTDQGDSLALFRRAGERVCPGCVFRTSCWKRERAATEKALRPAAEGMEKRGRADPGDFPVGFAARCSRLNELVNAVNQEYAGEQTRRRYRRKLGQARRALCRQYQDTARLLGESALALEEPAVPAMGRATLSALAGVAALRRPGQSVSGDAGGWFKDEDGVLWVALCDGMGSGSEAARDSRFAYRLLEQFLTAGIGPEVALATVSGALALRWETTGSFTTIDLLRLDLRSGEGTVYKLGAGPTYLRRDGVVSRLASTTLPAGLQEGAGPDVGRFRLGPGDLAVLVSDGVTDGSGDDWARELVRAFQGDSPKELAAALLDHQEEVSDDRTAIVLLMEGNQV